MSIIRIISSFIFLCLINISLLSQTCDPELILEKVDECCYDVRIGFSMAGCDYREVKLESHVTIGQYSDILNATTFNPNISVSINVQNNEISFISTLNLVTPASIATNISIGVICFANADDYSNANISSEFINTSGTAFSGGNHFIEVVCKQGIVNTDYSKICGDDFDNIPIKIFPHGDAVYVLGYRNDPLIVFPQTPHATISKYDAQTHNLLWTRQSDFPSKFIDAVYVPEDGSIVVIGRSEPNNPPSDNKSLIYKIDPNNGTVIFAKEMDFPGKETLIRIIRHPFSADPQYPYYILGSMHEVFTDGLPGQVPIIFNIDANANSNWIHKYPEKELFEDHKALIGIKNGNLIFSSNLYTSNQNNILHDCYLTEINYQDGSNVINPPNYLPYSSYISDDGIRLYDVQRTFTDELIWVGSKANDSKGITVISLEDQTILSVNEVTDFDKLIKVNKDINHNFYINSLPSQTLRPQQEPVLIKSKFNGFDLLFGYAKFLSNGESDYILGDTYTSPLNSAVLYSDSRLNHPNGHGGWDQFLSIGDDDLLQLCVDSINDPFIPSSLEMDNYQIGDFSISVTELQLSDNFDPINYDCDVFCFTGPCLADFDWNPLPCSLDIELNEQAIGALPITFEWDIDCDGTVEATTTQLIWPFSGLFSYQVCLKITDVNGCMDSIEKTITVSDQTPPIIDCPDDITLHTRPGLCDTTYLPLILAYDDCSEVTYECTFSGATSQDMGEQNIYAKGVTSVTCIATDDSGNSSLPCSFTVTVLDIEPPVIQCVFEQNEIGLLCADGDKVEFIEPTVTDNCPMVSYAPDVPSNSWFTCGQSTVTWTATDMSGNTSTCTTIINMECPCVSLVSSDVECSSISNQYNFTIVIEEHFTNNMTAATCSIVNVISLQGYTVIVNPLIWSGNEATITGTVDISSPFPTTIELEVDLTCICIGGNMIDCPVVPVSLPVECCTDIVVDDAIICSEDAIHTVSINGIGQFSNVTWVRWYMSSAPCTSPPWSNVSPIQQGPIYQDLVIYPNLLNGDVCIYADIEVNDPGTPCSYVRSNVALLKLCDPVSCSISSDNLSYCYGNSPITPDPLTLNVVDPDCIISVQWYDGNGMIPGETGITYQPPTLNWTLGPDDCFQNFNYFVIVDGPCGPESCSVSLTLYNEDAPAGVLIQNMNFDQDFLPICTGEDIFLEFINECGENPPMWQWFSGTNSGGPWTPLVTVGTSNPYYNTNNLYQDIWYKVETTNGVCPTDEIIFHVPVRNQLSITDFQVVPTPNCEPLTVALSLEIDPCLSNLPQGECGCQHDIEWYKDGLLIFSDMGLTNTPVTHTYATPPLAGNYYAIVTNCCGERVRTSSKQVFPECKANIVGPCFICGDDQALLEVDISNLPPGVNCNYTWSASNGGNIIGPTNGDNITVDEGGTYSIIADCDGCIKEASYELPACGCSCNDVFRGVLWEGIGLPPTTKQCGQTLNWDCSNSPAFSRWYINCAGNDCNTDNTIVWSLFNELGDLVSDGIVQSGQVMVPSDYNFPSSGTYTLVLTGKCGLKKCTCEFFIDYTCADTCPCDPADVVAIGNAGFNISNVNGNPCSINLSPVSTEFGSCDTIDWKFERLHIFTGNPTLIDIGQSTGPSSTGYTFQFNSSQLRRYRFTMTITRFKSDGTVCSSNLVSKDVWLRCPPSINWPLPFSLCDPIFPNGGFDNATAGLLGFDGSVPGWINLEGYSSPTVVVDMNSAVEISGNFSDLAPVISDSLSCMTQQDSLLSFFIKRPEGLKAYPGERLVVRLYREGLGDINLADECDSDQCLEIMNLNTSDKSGLDLSDWVWLNASFDNSVWATFEHCLVENSNNVKLVMFLTNDMIVEQGEGYSKMLIDNICFNGDTSSVTSVNELNSTSDILFYPNPTIDRLYLDFGLAKELINQEVDISIFNMWGQKILNFSNKIESDHFEIDISDAPQGMYWIKISNQKFKVWHSVFAKVDN